MLNNSNEGMENGYVVLPVEKYNELIVAIKSAEQAVKSAEQTAERLIRLKTNYKGQVELDFDDEQIYKAAKKIYETSSFNTPERELIEPDKFSVWSSDLTHEVVADEETDTDKTE